MAREYVSLAGTNRSLPRTGILHPFHRRYFTDPVVAAGNLLFTPSEEERDSEWIEELNDGTRQKAERRGRDIIGEGAKTDCVICGINDVSSPYPICERRTGKKFMMLSHSTALPVISFSTQRTVNWLVYITVRSPRIASVRRRGGMRYPDRSEEKWSGSFEPRTK